MTEITRVPLQPLAKGSLGKLWLGVAAALAAAGGLAWAAMPARVQVQVLKAGAGPSPTLQDVVLIAYKGTLKDGKVFDQNEHAVMPVGGVVPGFSKALQQMQRGGKYHIVIPSSLGYGANSPPGIPANSELTFDVDLLDYINGEEYQRQMQMMQQMQAQRGGQPGGPGAPGEGAPPPPGSQRPGAQ